MATFRKTGKKWRAEVCKNRVRTSKTFHTKAQAQAWALQMEIELESGVTYGNKTVSDLLERYAESVSIHKRSAEREKNRIAALQRDALADVRLADLGPPQISEWRDRKLKEMKSDSVRRDWVLLSHAFGVAVKEWHWLRSNPMSGMSRPPESKPRTRRITQDEVDRLLFACGYDADAPCETITSRVGLVLLFALETALRAGEICDLTWDQVHERHVHIPKTKNGFARDVPLSKEARRLVDQARGIDARLVFGISTSQLDPLFRKAKKRALIEDLHFHDTRREALTRLAKVFGVMELAKISGHRNLSILQDVYYAPTVDDLADKLN